MAIEDVVVLQDVLALLGVPTLDLALRTLDRLRHQLGLEGDVVRHGGAVHDALGSPGVEQPHEVVRERQVEA